MAQICPETNEKVLYLECLECENRRYCNKKQIENLNYDNKEKKDEDI